MMNKDLFEAKAASYEQVNHRVANVERIAAAIVEKVQFTPDMQLMDFGSGTGLLLEKVLEKAAPYVKAITAVDISLSMNEQLAQKQESLPCDLEILQRDLTKESLGRTFDEVISSMTLHHIEDVEAMFCKLYGMLGEGGFIALADLETEDGSFHTEDTGVFHFGFEPEALIGFAERAGFKDIDVIVVSSVQKPERDYPVLLVTATK